MTANQILRAAAERITKMGWCQGSYGQMAEAVAGDKNGNSEVPAGSPCGSQGNLLFTPVGATCIIGALRQVAGDRFNRENDAAVDEAKVKLRTHLKVGNLADWNDTDGRTVGEVIDALKAASS